LAKRDFTLISRETVDFAGLMRALVQMANVHGMEIVSCAEEITLSQYAIKSGKCVDDDLIAELFGDLKNRNLSKKDPHQRKACGCVVSKDIGMFNTCLFDCQYCYATASNKAAENNYRHRHDPESPSLLDHFEIETQPLAKRQGSLFQLP
jgi:hypothetical protein